MKFLAAFLGSAAATAYTVCSFTQTWHATADTDCSDYAGGTEFVKVLVDQCTYSTARSKWHKVTSCTDVAVTQEWHGTDASCAVTAATSAANTLVSFTAVSVCTIVADVNAGTAAYSNITSLAGDSNAQICGATWTTFTNTAGNLTQTDACLAATTDNTQVSSTPAFLLPSTNGLGSTGWLRQKCYKFLNYTADDANGVNASTWFWKFDTCTSSAVFTVSFYTDNACAGTASALLNGITIQSSTYNCYVFTATTNDNNLNAITGFTYSNAYATQFSIKLGSVVTTGNTVSQPTVTTTAAAATTTATTTTTTTTTTDGAKTLVAGALAAVSMMYL